MEDNLQCKITVTGRQPSVVDDIPMKANFVGGISFATGGKGSVLSGKFHYLLCFYSFPFIDWSRLISG